MDLAAMYLLLLKFMTLLFHVINKTDYVLQSSTDRQTVCGRTKPGATNIPAETMQCEGNHHRIRETSIAMCRIDDQAGRQARGNHSRISHHPGNDVAARLVTTDTLR